MNIHQLSIDYLKEQDRLLMRINTKAGEELRLWLTRRLTGVLVPHLHLSLKELEARKAMLAGSSDDTKRLLSEIKKEESLQKTDFKTPYNAQVKALPLGSEPLLVTQIKLTTPLTGKLEIAFQENLPGSDNPRVFRVALETELLHGMVHLFEAAAEKAQWQLPTQAPTGSPEGLPDAGDDRPKYLN